MEQVQVTDPVWTGILNRLQEGACDETDLQEIEDLQMMEESKNIPNFDFPPWDNVILVTPRHGVWVQWNTAAIRKHSLKTGHRIYVCPAENTKRVDGCVLTLKEWVVVAGICTKQMGKLEGVVKLAMGMRAMVTMNIATEADLAKGSRGKIVDIVLDARDDGACEDERGLTILQFPPALIIFQPTVSSHNTFEGLGAGQIPVFPSEGGFNIEDSRGMVSQIVQRQYTLTAAYTFTDYKSQGQTLEHILVNLAKPPTGGLTPFNAYVALSRSQGWATICLLKPFKSKLFTQHPSEHWKERIDGWHY